MKSGERQVSVEYTKRTTTRPVTTISSHMMQLFVEDDGYIEQGDCDGTEMIIWRVSN